ncbi:pseudouridylate synthase [Dyadobacter sp. CY312]|uniref:pseudouridylate synthase n=1 Tax=Dyadobacter sp. CY312 TaxID=2907303 RepID=UPI001F1997C8|nr:pseudouridylate synthase [Dyadobacter sp. CY312]MCE7041473.1 pseudouridylate synthase [Dyadobacter sp. CY312]
MTASDSTQDPCFNPFGNLCEGISLPEKFTFPFDYTPHSLSLLASEMLRVHLGTQSAWQHNFGLGTGDGTVIGKMFGVLVVITDDGDLGYLAAFSGKLAGGNFHAGFVPPLFDGMENGGFLNAGMESLAQLSTEISDLQAAGEEDNREDIDILKRRRKNHSVALQNQIFDQYHFLNQDGEEKSLRDIFEGALYKNPPAGAGECAAPKLLQYAFQHKMKPVAMAEFWWGASPKSAHWKHGEFYPSCQEKCAPILAHMLTGIEMDNKPVCHTGEISVR